MSGGGGSGGVGGAKGGGDAHKLWLLKIHKFIMFFSLHYI